MTSETVSPTNAGAPADASQWTRILAKYRTPNHARSLFELAVSLLPFIAIWALAWWVLQYSGWLALGLAVFNALFLVRLFMIQHDCGHGAFFRSRAFGDWIGRGLGVLTLTPYDVWRQSHAIHHASTGNLDRRGTGDVPTLTVAEYRAKSRLGRLIYRLYRNPVVLFGLAPIYVFFLQNRVPVGLRGPQGRYWLNAMVTNALLFSGLGLVIWFGGFKPVLLVFLPTMMVASSIGMWLFFVQHQFEHTSWEHEENWSIHDAALHGSSYYVLPGVLRWFSANIGAHHIHHMASRIPFYRLSEVLRDHDILAQNHRLTLRESLGCARLHLWDEKRQRLLSFAQARQLNAA